MVIRERTPNCSVTRYLVLDVETTIGNNADPFDSNNRLICIGWVNSEGLGGCDHALNPAYFQELIDSHDVIVGCNLKFDLHWLKRFGLDFSKKKLYDISVAEYILSHQKHTFPSLNDMASAMLGERKLDIVMENYWSKGIDTDKIPFDVLSDYCKQDCVLTMKIAKLQMEKTPEYQKTIISLAMQDLAVLQEMEWNGLCFDRERANSEAEAALKEKEEIIERLKGRTKVPEMFNWNSTKQLSALLFGGKITYAEKIPNGVWKSGKRENQVKFKTVETTYSFVRQYNPLNGTETNVPGVWSTDEEHLTKLGKDGIVTDILRIRAIEKLIGTYLLKLPALQDEHNWGHKYIHGQFNQTTTATGRLASSRPCLQNFPPEANRLIVSRYGA